MPNGSINKYAGKRLKELDDEEARTQAQKVRAIEELKGRGVNAGVPGRTPEEQKRLDELDERLKKRQRILDSIK